MVFGTEQIISPARIPIWALAGPEKNYSQTQARDVCCVMTSQNPCHPSYVRMFHSFGFRGACQHGGCNVIALQHLTSKSDMAPQAQKLTMITLHVSLWCWLTSGDSDDQNAPNISTAQVEASSTVVCLFFSFTMSNMGWPRKCQTGIFFSQVSLFHVTIESVVFFLIALGK